MGKNKYTSEYITIISQNTRNQEENLKASKETESEAEVETTLDFPTATMKARGKILKIIFNDEFYTGSDN